MSAERRDRDPAWTAASDQAAAAAADVTARLRTGSRIGSGPLILVQVRCKVGECGRLLDEVEAGAPPATDEGWTWYAFVHLCPKHGEGAGYGNIRAWQGRQRRAGKPGDRVEIGQWIQWAELRPAVERARLHGRTENYFR